MEQVVVEECGNGSLPYDLLLLADETRDAINKYIFDSDVFTVKMTTESPPIGVFAVIRNSPEELELKNIAVKEDYQRKGIGKLILDKTKSIARQSGYTKLTVGTSDTGADQLRFYEANGFVRSGLRKDFFLLNYTEPIYENGIQMKDMVMLTFNLQ